IIAPLIFGTLVVGIAGHSNLRQVGRLGLRSIIYFEIVTTIAIFLGLAAINISKAGTGVQLPATPGTETAPVTKLSAQDTILHIFPENIAKSVADGAVLEVVVFSLIFAVALAMISEQKRRPMLAFCESLSDVMFKFTNLVMYLAPLGVGAAVAYTVGHTGLGILASLLKLLLTLYVALAVFVLGVLLPIALIFRVPLRRFLKAVAEPVTIAFGTASSEAALPRAMEAMEAIGVPRQIVAFVILLATASSPGLPTEPVFLLLGVDQLLDMGRTAVNVLGNCLASVVMAKWEGEFGTEAPSPAVKEAVLQ